MKFISINISHYCEKVRWTLDYLNLEYFENQLTLMTYDYNSA